MKKSLQFLVLILTLTSLLCPDLFCQGTVETRSFNSPFLGATKNYRIYLPEGYYQSTDNYPVVYFFRNHESEWFIYSSLKQIADGLIQAGLIGKMILVGPNSGSNDGTYAGCVNMLRPDLAPSSGIGTGKFEDYIVTDLVTHIDTLRINSTVVLMVSLWVVSYQQLFHYIIRKFFRQLAPSMEH